MKYTLGLMVGMWAIATLAACSNTKRCSSGSRLEGDQCVSALSPPNADGTCPSDNPQCDICSPSCKIGEYCQAGSVAECVPYKVTQTFDLENIRNFRAPWSNEFEYAWSDDALIVSTTHEYPDQKPTDAGIDQYTVIRALDLRSDRGSVAEKWKRVFEPTARSADNDGIWEHGAIASASNVYVDNGTVIAPLVTRYWVKEGTTEFDRFDDDDAINLIGALPVFIDATTGVVAHTKSKASLMATDGWAYPFTLKFYPLGEQWYVLSDAWLNPLNFPYLRRGVFVAPMNLDGDGFDIRSPALALLGLDVGDPASTLEVLSRNEILQNGKLSISVSGFQKKSPTVVANLKSQENLTPVNVPSDRYAGYVAAFQIDSEGNRNAYFIPIQDELRSTIVEISFFDSDPHFIWAAGRVASKYMLWKLQLSDQSISGRYPFSATSTLNVTHAVSLKNNEVLLGGRFVDSLRLTNYLTAESNGAADIFVAGVDLKTGRVKFLKTFGSQGKDDLLKLFVDPKSDQNEWYVAARFGGQVDLGNGPVGDDKGVSLLWRMTP